MRIGNGYDVHRLVAGRDLILCGEKIPYELGLLGHSDADVATHAIMDALLGAMGKRDIGVLFPDNDQTYKGISSQVLLKKVGDILIKEGYRIYNIDTTIIAQAPKLSQYIPNMVKNIAKTLSIDENEINIKATTTEMLGFEGRGEGISAMAVVLIGKE